MAKLSDELHDICRGHFSVEERVSKRTGYPADTFLDLSGWGKGLVWVNGFNLGWYWPLLGPQMTMYVPGPLLKVSGNEVVLLEFAQEASDVSGEAVAWVRKVFWLLHSKHRLLGRESNVQSGNNALGCNHHSAGVKPCEICLHRQSLL